MILLIFQIHLENPLHLSLLTLSRTKRNGISFSLGPHFPYQFGYTNKFIHVIQVPSCNIQSKIEINGLLSVSIILIQGFRQGFPLSMMVCIIALEILAIFINADTKIEGIQIGDHEIKAVNFK